MHKWLNPMMLWAVQSWCITAAFQSLIAAAAVTPAAEVAVCAAVPPGRPAPCLAPEQEGMIPPG
eukprot:CAMPEP_0202891842 /NCGR_PEP_ID=MMETSP1392-20130828/1792_1 /ASSEMBLY_ACC=CAM_ASM_000868 /TAXON_ID=225041 /ORGANISM="Chlamydomonas chlamydogama, Strain SAG 11-48b" /LENGTH=63 /DNA_ID=CAMNT_0049575703 /DNA_START=518 /DNA_END=709 /DNA_ORIENTATION=-